MFSHKEYESNSYTDILPVLSSFNYFLNANTKSSTWEFPYHQDCTLQGKQVSGLAVLIWLQCPISCWPRRSFDSSNQECSCVSWQDSLEEGQKEDPSQTGSQTDRCIYNMPLKRLNLGWSINYGSHLLFKSSFFQVQQYAILQMLW